MRNGLAVLLLMAIAACAAAVAGSAPARLAVAVAVGEPAGESPVPVSFWVPAGEACSVTVQFEGGGGGMFVTVEARKVGDVDADGLVGAADVLLLQATLGLCGVDAGFNPVCDFNADGCVDTADLLMMAENFEQASAD